MHKELFIALLLSALLLSSCSVTPTPIDPTIVSTSYDYTKPADIAAQSKPVFVLPVINKGWIPARVDPRTGDWISGHYKATIVQDGYWATLEEAELSGRPYILAGDGNPIIPAPVPGGQRQGGGGTELSLANMQSRINRLESNKPSASDSQATQEQLAQISNQINSLSQQLPETTTSQTLPSNQTHGYQPGLEIEGSTPPPTSVLPTQTANSGPFFENGQETTLVLPSMPTGSVYEIPRSQNQADNLTVYYVNPREVQINYQGKEYMVRLNNPNDKVRVTIPSR